MHPYFLPRASEADREKVGRLFRDIIYDFGIIVKISVTRADDVKPGKVLSEHHLRLFGNSGLAAEKIYSSAFICEHFEDFISRVNAGDALGQGRAEAFCRGYDTDKLIWVEQ